MIRGEGVGREIRTVHLVIVLYDTLQGISAMLILALSIFVLPIGENAADVQIVFDLLEDVVVFDKSFNRGNSKDSRVLTISRFSFVAIETESTLTLTIEK